MSTRTSKSRVVENMRIDSEDGYYTGTVKGDKPHGKGTIRWKNGDVFEGHFKKGEK